MLPMMARIVLLLGLVACNAVGQVVGSGTIGGNGSNGIEGTVLIGPTCPVEPLNDPKCADRPYQASLKLLNPAGTEVGRFTTDKDGAFRVGLEPGRYTIEAVRTGVLPSFAPQTVDVTAGNYTKLTLLFDSGIR
jgi:hypothetical protein